MFRNGYKSRRRSTSVGDWFGSIMGGALVLAFVGVVGFGWINNILILMKMTFDVFTPEMVLRILGVVMFPIGVVMGYL